MTTTLESLINSAAWSVVNDEGSFNAERSKLNTIVRTLLHNAVTQLREENQRQENTH